MDRELSASKTSITLRNIDFIKPNLIKKVNTIISKILGDNYNEVKMEFKDKDENINFFIFFKRTFWKVIKQSKSENMLYSYNQDIKIFNKNHEPGTKEDFKIFIDYLTLPFSFTDEEFDKINLTFK